jgi:hypothetical protein
MTIRIVKIQSAALYKLPHLPQVCRQTKGRQSANPDGLGGGGRRFTPPAS